jgi:ATP-binding cassette subfamily B (MDR/TAP) protein 1
LGEVVQLTVVAVGSLAVALYFSWSLALIIICTSPVLFLIMSWLSGKLSKSAHQQADKLQQALKYVTSAISNIETVKCFNGQRYEIARYARAIASAGASYKKQANLRSAQIGLMQFYSLSIFFQGFWYGSHLVSTDKDTPGNVVTTFWTSLMAVQAIAEFQPQFIILQKGRVAATRLRKIMDQIARPDGIEGNTRGRRPDRCTGDIQFDKVRMICFPLWLCC